MLKERFSVAASAEIRSQSREAAASAFFLEFSKMSIWADWERVSLIRARASSFR
jgi:hypothetical protein